MCQQTRETETWMPPMAMESLQNHPGESSGDFGFTDDNQEDQDQTVKDYYEDSYNDEEDEDYEDETSGSGDANESKSGRVWLPPTEVRCPCRHRARNCHGPESGRLEIVSKPLGRPKSTSFLFSHFPHLVGVLLTPWPPGGRNCRANVHFESKRRTFVEDGVEQTKTQPKMPSWGNWPLCAQVGWHPKADNGIPERSGPAVHHDPEPETAPDDNEIRSVRNSPRLGSQLPSNVLMSHAAEGVFTRMEVLAALICGGGVALTVAVLLVVLLLHRMKKKDEGSYELVRKPIYTKAPTAEIYA
ncbi:syndecan-4 isoform 2-T3 [Syngnathus typhle]